MHLASMLKMYIIVLLRLRVQVKCNGKIRTNALKYIMILVFVIRPKLETRKLTESTIIMPILIFQQNQLRFSLSIIVIFHGA